MAARYEHNYAAFDRLVLCAPFMVAEMEKRGLRVLARAELTAPFYADDPDGDHYRDDFAIEAGVRVIRTRRAYCRISNSNSAALIVEYGNVNTPRHRTLGNALDAAG